MKRLLTTLSKAIRKKTLPQALLKKNIHIDSAALLEIESSVKRNYHKGWRGRENYTDEAYQHDLRAHVIGRLESDRITYIPWLNRAVRLNGANILEIGCGTGSSTVALCEQGANVVAVDIDEDALAVACDRCNAYKVKPKIIAGNAIEISDQFKVGEFDLIIFFACMEHMTYEERIESINKYYTLLSDGGVLAIIETPNRLWFYDGHTAFLPFFHWLPDRLAYDYTKFSSRKNFMELYTDYSDDKFLHFLRRGRGFSFHELEVSLNIPVSKLKVLSFMNQRFIPFSKEYRFYNLLRTIFPGISNGFCQPNINMMIKKVKAS